MAPNGRTFAFLYKIGLTSAVSSIEAAEDGFCKHFLVLFANPALCVYLQLMCNHTITNKFGWIAATKMSKNHTNIPLHCSICPKNPQFSDVSHLLTHTSSKAHLSNYFKLKIRAASELTAKIQLDNFEDWYDNYDLERLLSERLASKDQKKAAKDKKTRSNNALVILSCEWELLNCTNCHKTSPGKRE